MDTKRNRTDVDIGNDRRFGRPQVIRKGFQWSDLLLAAAIMLVVGIFIGYRYNSRIDMLVSKVKGVTETDGNEDITNSIENINIDDRTSKKPKKMVTWQQLQGVLNAIRFSIAPINNEIDALESAKNSELRERDVMIYKHNKSPDECKGYLVRAENLQNKIVAKQDKIAKLNEACNSLREILDRKSADLFDNNTYNRRAEAALKMADEALQKAEIDLRVEELLKRSNIIPDDTWGSGTANQQQPRGINQTRRRRMRQGSSPSGASGSSGHSSVSGSRRSQAAAATATLGSIYEENEPSAPVDTDQVGTDSGQPNPEPPPAGRL